jgi:hypothetical protein
VRTYVLVHCLTHQRLRGYRVLDASETEIQDANRNLNHSGSLYRYQSVGDPQSTAIHDTAS